MMIRTPLYENIAMVPSIKIAQVLKFLYGEEFL
jgi:hypothetical protein